MRFKVIDEEGGLLSIQDKVVIEFVEPSSLANFFVILRIDLFRKHSARCALTLSKL